MDIGLCNSSWSFKVIWQQLERVDAFLTSCTVPHLCVFDVPFAHQGSGDRKKPPPPTLSGALPRPRRSERRGPTEADGSRRKRAEPRCRTFLPARRRGL